MLSFIELEHIDKRI